MASVAPCKTGQQRPAAYQSAGCVGDPIPNGLTADNTGWANNVAARLMVAQSESVTRQDGVDTRQITRSGMDDRLKRCTRKGRRIASQDA
jgi:hypothetical protein